MLNERIEQMANELGLGATDVAQLSELHYSTVPGWKRRVSNGMWENDLPGEKFIKFAFRWMHNPTWFLSDGTTYERWSPEMVGARRELLPWARAGGFDSPCERLVAAHRKLKELAPSLREEIWAAYICSVECRRTGSTNTGNYEYAGIDIGEWLRCKRGERQPDERQLKGAELLTGLPLAWFQTGELPLTDHERLCAAMAGAGRTVDDVLMLLRDAR